MDSNEFPDHNDSKQCARCRRALPITEFRRRKISADGRSGTCKRCCSAIEANCRGGAPEPWPTPEERFWARVDKSLGPEECWPWLGPSDLKFWVDGKNAVARRFLFDLLGEPVPETHKVIDTCGSAVCMNREHLITKPKGNGLRHGAKICSACRKEKPLSEFSPCKTGALGRFNWCKPCNARHQGSLKTRKPSAQRTYKLARYGLTLDDYQAMSEAQKHVCAICGEPGDINGLGVDHDHDTGTVRALLCGRCNSGLGLFLHDPERMRKAREYLMTWKMVIQINRRNTS